jgi:hypothetical protein
MRIFHIHLNTFPVFSEYTERLENTQKKCLLSKMPDEVKGTVFRENRMGDHKMACDKQIKKLIFWLSLT